MKKKILIALACILLLPLLAIIALFATREPPDGPRIEAAPGVVGVEAGGAYVWIVRTAHGAVLVDAGLDAAGTAIIAELKAEGVEPRQVQAVLITHGHPDHYAAARLFETATVAVGSADVAMMRGDKTHYSSFGRVVGSVMPCRRRRRSLPRCAAASTWNSTALRSRSSPLQVTHREA